MDYYKYKVLFPVLKIKDMEVGEANAEWTDARLIFKDDNGDEYHLFWGKGPMPGNFQRTTPSAPDVYVVRMPDLPNEGDGKSNWYVKTNAEGRSGQVDVHTAFLWRQFGPGAWDYCGAYNVSFSYTAIEE